MSTTITYARPKSTTTNATGIVLTLFASETPAALAALAGGTTAELQATWRADANESAATLIKDHMRMVVTPSFDATTQLTTYVIVMTPIHGDGTLGASHTFTVSHDETLDGFQTGAGRPRQP